MFGGLNRPLAAAAIATVFLVVPPAALADGCGGGPSAEHVYTECLQTGGGGKPTSGHGGGTAPAGSGGQSAGATAVPISSQTAKTLKKAGKDARPLKKLVKAYGLRRALESSHETAAAGPTAIGSAFDLGSGPTVLLIVLAGTAIVLLGAGGYRAVRYHR